MEGKNVSILDLSVGSPDIDFPCDEAKTEKLMSMISEKRKAKGEKIAIGLYQENRLWYYFTVQVMENMDTN